MESVWRQELIHISIKSSLLLPILLTIKHDHQDWWFSNNQALLEELLELLQRILPSQLTLKPTNVQPKKDIAQWNHINSSHFQLYYAFRPSDPYTPLCAESNPGEPKCMECHLFPSTLIAVVLPRDFAFPAVGSSLQISDYFVPSDPKR
eukprot:gnl/Trimastix_PCT/4874.p1 GENE.gnl/Trimastix_PCT/4874~~gnl/Trimastix_PCT/4874.p1  ORF type:complete len:149 (-),score=7.83 gnl/Trimastix_PCT/4874:122-568(-)